MPSFHCGPLLNKAISEAQSVFDVPVFHSCGEAAHNLCAKSLTSFLCSAKCLMLTLNVPQYLLQSYYCSMCTLKMIKVVIQPLH